MAAVAAAFLEARVDVHLELAHLVFEALDLELQLLDLAIHGAQCAFKPVETQDERRLVLRVHWIAVLRIILEGCGRAHGLRRQWHGQKRHTDENSPNFTKNHPTDPDLYDFATV